MSCLSKWTVVASLFFAVTACSTSKPSDSGSKTTSQSNGGSAPASAKIIECSAVNYWGGYVVSISKGDGERKIKAELERVKGPDGDGETYGPFSLEGEKVNGECDIYDFGKGYLKTCDGKSAELHVRDRNETEQLDCQ